MPADIESILKIEVPLSVEIASRAMKVREIANLAPGAIIELPKLSDEQLEVVIGGRPIGMGTAVKVGENFGVRITQVGSMKQRIRALSPGASESPPSTNGAESPDATGRSGGLAEEEPTEAQTLAGQ